MIRAKDLCHNCKNFDMGNYECKAGQYIEDMDSNEIVLECEDFEEKR